MKIRFKKKIKRLVSLIAVLVFLLGTIAGYKIYQTKADDFAATLNQFPESYRTALTNLHNAHPNWTFVPVNTGLDWNTVLTNESVLSRKLVPASGYKISRGLADMKADGVTVEWYATPTAWKAYDDIANAYNYSSNDWVGFDTGAWNQASTAAISYVMDPRNWLTEGYIFMFEQLGYNESHDTVDTINAALYGTFMYNTACPGAPNGESYAQVIVNAAKNSGVSAMHLAVRLVQEKGTSNDELGKGVSTSDGSTYYVQNGDGQTVYYNYFNIGACGSGKQAVINSGGAEAKSENWTSPYLAIMGGAVKVNTGYIAIGQDTIYFEMFSVVNSKYYYWKQYAQNLTATLTESTKIYTTYKNAGVSNASFVFRIPVYENMPSSACALPTSPSGDTRTTANPNTRLSGISVTATTMSGTTETISLTPSFNMNTTSYSMVLPYKDAKITINATAYASTTKISGTGTHDLQVGSNSFNIVATSEYGTTKTYTINITRQEGSTLLTALSPTKGSFNTDFTKEGYKYTIAVENDVTSLALNYKTESSIAYVKARGATGDKDLSGGTTGDITLNEGVNTVYIDVYPSTSDTTSSHTTYQVDIIRYTQISIDMKNLDVKDSGVSNFAMGESVSNALTRLSVSGGTAKITDKDGNVKGADSKIATGDILKIYDGKDNLYKQHTIILYGDVNGDGIVDIYDFGYIRKMIIKNTGLSGAYLTAADVYPDSAGVDVYDFGVIRRYIIKGTAIEQDR